mmetsp:Transcript_113496/g.197118  ORF Transcript_113496/g.197118 Transcript_113496/m.197118 type:complete len:224 (+) Transcript_113496:2335-3006(+)
MYLASRCEFRFMVMAFCSSFLARSFPTRTSLPVFCRHCSSPACFSFFSSRIVATSTLALRAASLPASSVASSSSSWMCCARIASRVRLMAACHCFSCSISESNSSIISSTFALPSDDCTFAYLASNSSSSSSVIPSAITSLVSDESHALSLAALPSARSLSTTIEADARVASLTELLSFPVFSLHASNPFSFSFFSSRATFTAMVLPWCLWISFSSKSSSTVA